MADGTTQTVMLRGDETFHFFVTADGQAVRENLQGLWEPDNRDIEGCWKAAMQRRQVHRKRLAQNRSAQNRLAHRTVASTDPAPTMKKGLLILVSFHDISLCLTTTRELFQQIMNGLGTPYARNHGSVREYFLEQSYGQFDIVFDVAGPVKVSKKEEYYGADTEEGHDIHPAQMVKEALNAIDSQVNFADYDWDGDGEVENIFIVYAGYSQAQGAPSTTIWPHQWTLKEATGSVMKKDGVIIDTYSCSSELNGTSGFTIAGVGTMCHEFSHCLGLPDFYDTNYQGAYGMSNWSVMDYGCNNGGGFCPCGFTAYERWFCGWLEPTVLNTPCVVQDMKNIEETPAAYVIYNDATPDEYYLLANHQKVGWDTSINGHGMMILHVDYDSVAWETNTVNTLTDRQRMCIFPADNTSVRSSYSLQTDLWTGLNYSPDFTDDSVPAATLNVQNTDGSRFMHKPIYSIREADGLVSFRFMLPEEDAVADLPLQARSPHTFFDLTGRPLAQTSVPRGLSVTKGRKFFSP